jgi:hypothetical protein
MEPDKLREIIAEKISEGLDDFLYRPITENNLHNIETVVRRSLMRMYEVGYIRDEIPPIRAIQLDNDPNRVVIQYIDEYGQLKPLDDWIREVTTEWYSLKMTLNS